MSPLPRVCMLAAATLLASPASTAETQRLSATIGGEAFASDDEGITLVPIAGSFTLIALTAGATSYPPPQTRVDQLSIRCTWTPGKPYSLDSKAFEQSICAVSYAKGSKPMGGAPDAEYTLDPSSPDNRFEITAVRGKAIEGSFSFRLKGAAGTTLLVEDGSFVAEDRQL